MTKKFDRCHRSDRAIPYRKSFGELLGCFKKKIARQFDVLEYVEYDRRNEFL